MFEFDFDVNHKTGVKQPTADVFSRLPTSYADIATPENGFSF